MRLNKAQSLAEYALLATIVIAAIAGMQVYLKRGLQAKVKTFVDGATEGVSSLAGRDKPLSQYEPYYVQSDITTEALQKVATTHIPGGSTKRELLPAVKNDEGNYADGNVVIRKGTVRVNGTSDAALAADDDWEK